MSRFYREGEDEIHGRVRAVHLHELLALEEQYVPTNGVIDRAIRAHWPGQSVPPLIGAMVSLHVPGQRVLVRVTRVARSCNCCVRGACALVYMREMPETRRLQMECECTTKVGWSDADKWHMPTDPRRKTASDGGHAQREMSGILGLFRRKLPIKEAL